MKPSWDDAPDWAEWLGRSSDGNWTWFQVKPILDDTGDFLQQSMTLYQEIDFNVGPYLEERP